MEKNYTEVQVVKDKIDLNVNAEPTTVTTVVEEAQTDNTQKRKRRTRVSSPSLADEDIINNNKDTNGKNDEEQIKLTVNKVMNTMKERYNIPTPLDTVISDSELNSWKKQYGEIYRTDLNGQIYVWHKLRRKEYITIMDDAELTAVNNPDLRIFLRQEKIVKVACLYPSGAELDDIVENNAGVAVNISDEIMLASGFRTVRSEKL